MLLNNGQLIKTVGFKKPRYVGDPLNAVRILNEKEVDELIIMDKSVASQDLDFNFLQRIASYANMPLSYCGGVQTAEQVRKIISLGFEKVFFAGNIFNKKTEISLSISQCGSQSIGAVLDMRYSFRRRRLALYECQGSRILKHDPVEAVNFLQELGIGEILLQSISHDGKMGGYDQRLVEFAKSNIKRAYTICGGAGSLEHIQEVVKSLGPVGVAASSLFIFSGRYKAVLISYPSRRERRLVLEMLE